MLVANPDKQFKKSLTRLQELLAIGNRVIVNEKEWLRL